MDATFHFDLIKNRNNHKLKLCSYRQSPRNRPPSPGAMKQRPPSPQPTAAKPPPIQKPALTPPGPPLLRKRDSKSKDMCPALAASAQSSDSSKTKEKDGEQFSVIITIGYKGFIVLHKNKSKVFHICTKHAKQVHKEAAITTMMTDLN